MKHILITGSAGFIGARFADLFASEYELTGIDIKPRATGAFTTNYQLDVRDTEAIKRIFSTHLIDCVIHTAAEKSLAACESDLVRAKAINHDATMRLAELTEAHGGKFIFLSSDQVFDGKRGNYSEAEAVSPINAYGYLKCLVEKELGTEPWAAICRTAMVFGPVPPSQMDALNTACQTEKLQVQGYIVQHARSRLERGQKIHLPADEFINPTHVDLLAMQLRKVIERDLSGVIHCCGGQRVSRYEFGLYIAKKFGLQTSGIVFAPDSNPLRPKDVSLDFQHSQKLLGLPFSKVEAMLNLSL